MPVAVDRFGFFSRGADMMGAGAAAVAATAAFAGLGGIAWWYPALGLWFGVVQESPAVVAAGVMVGLGFGIYQKASGYERRRDEDAREALLFLVRLRQLVSVTGTLAAALDEMGYRTGWTGSDAGERVLVEVALRLKVTALTFLGRVAMLVRRHGGSLLPVVDWAADTIQTRQSLREVRHLEETAQRSTVIILALAPWGVLMVFRIMVPGFYRILMTTRIGDGALLMIGCMTLAVLAVLSQYIRREALIR